MNFRLAETCVRCAGQDDDPHSGSREIFARVKPGKHFPVLWDEKKLPARKPVGDGVLDVPRPQGNRLQPRHRQSNRQAQQRNKYKPNYSKETPHNRTII
jgi:hypothetical protein